MFNRIKDFATSLVVRAKLAGEEGQAMVEYGIIVGIISIAAITAILAIGGDLTPIFEKVQHALEGK